MRGVVLAAAVAAAMLTAAAPVARAEAGDHDDPAIAKAKKLTTDGRKLFDLGKFAQALAKFEAAYEISPIPGLLFNIGQCHRNLGDYDAAIFSFKKYLRLLPEAPNRAAVEDYIAELEHEQQKQSAGDLGLLPPERDPEDRTVGGPVDRPRHGAPFYKKWWFWGGVAAVGATAAGVVILSSGGPPGTSLGNVDFSK